MPVLSNRRADRKRNIAGRQNSEQNFRRQNILELLAGVPRLYYVAPQETHGSFHLNVSGSQRFRLKVVSTGENEIYENLKSICKKNPKT